MKTCLAIAWLLSLPLGIVAWNYSHIEPPTYTFEVAPAFDTICGMSAVCVRDDVGYTSSEWRVNCIDIDNKIKLIQPNYALAQCWPETFKTPADTDDGETYQGD